MLKPLREFNFGARPLVVAHRGSSGTAPENTMAAVREGVAAGADMVEIDIQALADGTIIVFHDSVLGRTTDGSGHIARLTYPEAMQLDAGSWMAREFADERIPTLAQVLDYLHGKVYVNIEVKRYGETSDDDRPVFEAIRLLHDAGMLEHALISSFDHALLAHARREHPELICAVIMHPDDRGLPSERALPVGAEAVVLAKHQLSYERAADAKAHNLPLAVYTVNTEPELERVLRYDVETIVTNFPARIVAAMRERGVEM